MRTKLILSAILAVATHMTITGAAGAEVTPQASDNLESLFLNPPDSAKPYVWWHWMGSNFSKSGITRDLEAMKATGIGGATVFNISSAVQESHAPTLNNPTRSLQNRWIIAGDWKLIVPDPRNLRNAKPALYQLKQDPWELKNLADAEFERV